MTTRLALVGAAGAMGRQIIKGLREHSAIELIAALESGSGPECGRPVEGLELRYSADLSAGISQSDGVIDFSTPESSVEAMKVAANLGKPILIGTTGHSAAQLDLISSLAEQTPTLICSNSSIGIWALRELAKSAKAILGDGFDIEIFELHHRRKVDAPSGTALSLGADLVGDQSAKLKLDRSARREARTEGEIGVASARGGDVCGEHTVYFIGQGERLELSHRVWNRQVFAVGALRLFSNLLNKSNGLYSVSDLVHSQS